MVQWLRAFQENRRLNSRIHKVVSNHLLTPVQGDLMPSVTSTDTAHTVNTHICRQNSHTYKIMFKINKITKTLLLIITKDLTTASHK